jgi:catechol 2,3-dioxygenase-like lactoylglutathione lyase family enzyme
MQFKSFHYAVGALALALVSTASVARHLPQSHPKASHVSTRPPIIGVAHIALQTNDSAAEQEFFGHVLGFDSFDITDLDGSTTGKCYKVSDHQYIEVYPTLHNETDDRLLHIAFETTDARKLRDFLAGQNVPVPAALKRDSNKNYSFTINDPDGHKIEFVQYLPGGLQGRQFGKLLPSTRVSEQMIHVGFTISDRAASDKIFKDILGFQETWHGGMNDTETKWVDMRVPDGSNWLEYMLNVRNPSPKSLGVNNHLALGVTSIQPMYKEVLARGYKPPEGPKIGRDGKWQLNMYDHTLTRVEGMEFKPVQTPCCSPMLTSDRTMATSAQ